ncbi:MAG: methyltransferase [Oscillospiraceae bacterium]|nr:methyltransferase [Oscillospiraceae bacterium]
MSIPAFDPKELEVKASFPFPVPGNQMNVLSYPFPMSEALKAALDRKPWFVMNGFQQTMFSPMVNPDAIARGMVIEARQLPMEQFGGPDMFGIEWEYIEKVGGSMVRPGKPFCEDANEIMEKIVWPDPDSWDWEGAREANKGYLNPDNWNDLWFMNGWYERLISFMDFENAIMAIFDEDQQDAVHTFFDKLTDLYIKIFDKYIEYFPEVCCFCIHDDWGSQKETFFSPATAEEMIVPYMRRLTDFIHSKGRICELHSCGQNMKQVPNFIKAGWDLWNPQEMNDTRKMYELYGDQIILGVCPDHFSADATEEEQRAAARAYVDEYWIPGKTFLLNYNDKTCWTPAFLEEVYAYSRQKACGMI